MRVAITGTHGMLGAALARSLRADGHEVQRLVRRPAAAADEVGYDPETDIYDLDRLEKCNAVVHLAGSDAGLRRWDAADLRTYQRSRFESTRKICQNVSLLVDLPEVIVAASSLAFCGSPGDVPVDETARRGAGAAAEFVEEWESATDMVTAVGMRLVLARFGAVLAPAGGLLDGLRRAIADGRDPTVGHGNTWFSWVHLDDAVRALRRLIETPALQEVVHVTAPTPARQREVGQLLGAAGPQLSADEVAARFGSDRAEQWLADRRGVPAKLLANGFAFAHPTLDAALGVLAPR